MRGFVIAGLLVGMSGAAKAAVIAINDASFESDDRSDNDGNGYGPISDWTRSGNAGTNSTSQPFNNGHTIPDGSLIAFVQGVGEISQTLSGLVSGQTYELSYYEDSRGNTLDVGSHTEVDLGGQTVVASHAVSSTPTYVHQIVDFTYTGSGGLLELKSLDPATNGSDDNSALFDDISLVTTPEPASMVLGGIGSLLMLACRRRR